MQTQWKHGLACCVLIYLMVFLIGCAALNRQRLPAVSENVDPERIVSDLTPDIEALYLSWHELNATYKDLKFLERGFLFEPNDNQLAYIQKATLYVQDASVRIHHAWDRLSVLHYIRADRMRDYLTLTVNALTVVIDEIGYDLQFIDIYAAFIAHAAIGEDLDRARTQMETTTALLKRIQEQLVQAIR